MSENNKSNWWIWKVFWILLGLTTVEVALGIFKVNGFLPHALVHDHFIGLKWLTHIFIILTLIKARRKWASYVFSLFFVLMYAEHDPWQ